MVSEILDICELIEFQYAQACLEYRQASDSITICSKLMLAIGNASDEQC